MDEAAQKRRVEALLRRLTNPERRWRWQSTLQALGEVWFRPLRKPCLLGPSGRWPNWPKLAPTPEAIRIVGRCLDDPRPELRVAVMYALRNPQPHVDEALPFLAAGLRDPHVPVRLNAIAIIRGHAEWAAPIVPVLKGALADRVRTVRAGAACTLTFVAPSAELIPVLLEAMPRGDAWMVTESLAGLGRLGRLAAPAVPAIVERVEKGIGRYLEKAVDALCLITGEEDVPGLSMARLRRMREAAPTLDGAYFNHAQEVAEAMPPFLASEDSILRVHAVSKVRDYGRPVPGLHARLTELLEDGSAFVRAEAAAYLLQREVLTAEALSPWLARQREEVTRHLVDTLSERVGHTEAMLRELARSEDASTRTRALRFLGEAP